MIIFQMPFIFNGIVLFHELILDLSILFIAAWKIIKNWLPPQAIKLIKFVDKKSIKEFVHESQLFVHMGGTVIIYYFINYHLSLGFISI